MAIYKGSYQNQYTTLPNTTARDTNLTLQARGLLLYLISLPGEWRVSRKNVGTENGINEKTVQKYLNELKAHGYVEYVLKRKENSRFSGGDYFVYPEPQTHITNPSEPSDTSGSTADPKSGRTEKTACENRTYIKKKESKKERSTTTDQQQKIDFEVFAATLMTILNDMLSEGGWLRTDDPRPHATWLKPKSERLYDRLKHPDPADCAIIILNDWITRIHQ